MKTHKYDILIVGAGPAGSATALTAARKGLRVLMVERRARVGTPVRCAEYIPAPLLGEVDLGRHFVVQAIRGMRTFLPGGEIKKMLAPGFTIRRDNFDQTLADAAREAGVEILLSTRALSRNKNEVFLKGKNGLPLKVKPTVIIGADGPRSTVGRWIGIVNRNLIPAVQVRVPLIHRMEYTEVHFKKEIYGGYGWLFPKGHEANVGIGMKQEKGKREPISHVLKRFVSRLSEEGKIRGETLGNVAGWIPAEPVRKVIYENIMLVGDAAGQTHPITGAGVSQAVICGRMAGNWAARAVEEGDLGLLSEYEKEWRDLFGDTLKRAFTRRQLMEKEWDRLEEIIKYCWIAYREYYNTLT